jgi:hypothetical protein
MDVVLDAWRPIGASAQHLTGRVELEALLVDWVAFNEALDDLQTYLRETQKPSGEFPQVDVPSCFGGGGEKKDA